MSTDRTIYRQAEIERTWLLGQSRRGNSDMNPSPRLLELLVENFRPCIALDDTPSRFTAAIRHTGEAVNILRDQVWLHQSQ